ncbi:MAG TPA: UbiX family flavin prenyltransferase [Firmicutes bacterium]|nr:UbiX family flavin prenyltransferase [Bacillota bacterium]
MLVVGITGASGALYAARLLDRLLASGTDVALCLTEPAGAVLRHELDWPLPADPREAEGVRRALAQVFPPAEGTGRLTYYAPTDWGAPIASGSAPWEGMVVVPCSMGTAARLAHGISGNLLERAADVCLKERRPLVVVPREAPLSVIHLENLLALARAGAVILPAAPGFYHRPRSLEELADFVVGRILQALGRPGGLTPAWGAEEK